MGSKISELKEPEVAVNYGEIMGKTPDDFAYLQILGKGAFGTIFKVRNKRDSKIYALKRLNVHNLSQDEIAKIKERISGILKLRWGNITKYYTCFADADHIYVTMEYINNGDLYKYIDMYNVLNAEIDENIIWSIAEKCLRSLVYLHRNSIIHRDIKPHNILLDENMDIKLADFGVSQFNSGNLSAQNMDKQGTVFYMSPEMLANKNYSYKTDVFSFGCVLFFLAFKKEYRTNYLDLNVPNSKMEMRNNSVPENKYSKELNDLIINMLKDDESERFSSEQAYDLAKKHYFKNSKKSSGLAAVACALFALKEFVAEIGKHEDKDKTVIICLSYLFNNLLGRSSEPFSQCFILVNEILSYNNIVIEFNKEINPVDIIEFVILKTNKEFKSNLNAKKALIASVLPGEDDENYEELAYKSFVKKESCEFQSIFLRDFRVVYRLKNTCKKCDTNTFSYNTEFFIKINLHKIFALTSDYDVSIKSCLSLISEKQYIDHDLFCKNCSKFCENSINRKIYSLPKTLVLLLERDKSNNNIFVDYDRKLDLNDLFHNSFGSCSNINLSNYEYNLKAAVHYNINADKYYAIYADNNSWIERDIYEYKNVDPMQSKNKGDILYCLIYEM